ncbi:DgyrCDS4672 [Dimorphilus gyrociliatus]|uniref:DgyrCDS4672 n=1 Tax=Dimorphilus gyrociliatus TaxID=2664684 RepID=A0A7I8VHB8_9ANNE|nr:DgyrCDS4672 [Dimorphilus gyrociliatus]
MQTLIDGYELVKSGQKLNSNVTVKVDRGKGIVRIDFISGFYAHWQPESTILKSQAIESTGLNPFVFSRHTHSFEYFNRYDQHWFSTNTKIKRPADNPEPEGIIRVEGLFRIEDYRRLANQTKIWMNIAVNVNGMIWIGRMGSRFFDSPNRVSNFDTQLYVVDQRLENNRQVVKTILHVTHLPASEAYGSNYTLTFYGLPGTTFGQFVQSGRSARSTSNKQYSDCFSIRIPTLVFADIVHVPFEFSFPLNYSLGGDLTTYIGVADIYSYVDSFNRSELLKFDSMFLIIPIIVLLPPPKITDFSSLEDQEWRQIFNKSIEGHGNSSVMLRGNHLYICKKDSEMRLRKNRCFLQLQDKGRFEGNLQIVSRLIVKKAVQSIAVDSQIGTILYKHKTEDLFIATTNNGRTCLRGENSGTYWAADNCRILSDFIASDWEKSAQVNAHDMNRYFIRNEVVTDSYLSAQCKKQVLSFNNRDCEFNGLTGWQTVGTNSSLNRTEEKRRSGVSSCKLDGIMKQKISVS